MATPSTFMVQNLPSRWSTEEIRSVIDESGFQDAYDFFYVPRRSAYHRSQSYGYAFINFHSSAKAQAFRAAAENDALLFKKRLAKVMPAVIQGIEALEAHFKGKNVMKSVVAPVFEADMRLERPISRHEGTPNAPATASEAASPIVPVAVDGIQKRASSIRWCDVEDEFDE
eukprot:TRINITY_DN9774_c0_g2_i1.p1 TRINITY_DN9774_c0_g2~~TRINITY_DN9774_c0_g2_i1.p1  ORF type:complete len:171 (-),score=32.65 TRINITY_DN9774_c0_g2_i1:395-907(-)